MSSFSKLSFFFLAGLLALPVAGCAADTSDESAADEGAEQSEDELRRATIAPGVFKLYSDANATPNESCDVHTRLELVSSNGARARLSERLGEGSRCRLAVFPNEREFRLTQSSTSCGSKIYKGTRQKDGKTHKITVTDHRTRMCRDLVPAKIIIEETVPGFPGPITTTKYSYDGPAPIHGQWPAGDKNSLSGKLFTAMKNHAQGTPSDTMSYVQAVGGSTVTYENDGVLAQCTGAVLAGGVRYTCRFAVKPGGFDWTMSSDSVQAELHEALRVATSGGRVAELKDGANGLRCEATTLGMAQVMSYRCEVSIAP